MIVSYVRFILKEGEERGYHARPYYDRNVGKCRSLRLQTRHSDREKERERERDWFVFLSEEDRENPAVLSTLLQFDKPYRLASALFDDNTRPDTVPTLIPIPRNFYTDDCRSFTTEFELSRGSHLTVKQSEKLWRPLNRWPIARMYVRTYRVLFLSFLLAVLATQTQTVFLFLLRIHTQAYTLSVSVRTSSASRRRKAFRERTFS